ncbi:hypothetical protein LOB16_08015 [Lactobacillus delbrueckii subsp. bulgaricus]|nr:hypothetical protein [Lactobacillus delbrueckii subsp. bulgaricus]
MTKQGHEFTAYDSFSTDTEELKKRSEGADALIIANHLLPGEVIRADKNLSSSQLPLSGLTMLTWKPARRKRSISPTLVAIATTRWRNWPSV